MYRAVSDATLYNIFCMENHEWNVQGRCQNDLTAGWRAAPSMVGTQPHMIQM
jgi:hypothetical protein